MTVVETLIPIGRPLSVLRLDLDSTVYTTVRQQPRPTRSERLRKVTDEAGRALAFVHDHDEAVVQLAEPAAAERPIKLKFEIDGDFLVSPAGDSYWELGIHDWFPQPSLAGQLYTFHAVGPRQEAVRSVRPRQDDPAHDRGRRERARDARRQADLLRRRSSPGGTRLRRRSSNGVTIRVATYALDNPRAVKQLTNLAGNIIQYYEEFLGPFPMPEFNIIEINDIGWGQAPPGTMFITKEAFNPDHDGAHRQGVYSRASTSDSPTRSRISTGAPPSRCPASRSSGSRSPSPSTARRSS